VRASRRLGSILLPAVLCSACGLLNWGGGEGHYHQYSHVTVVPPAHPQGVPGEYTVQPGDTLYSIAFRHQIDYHDLAAWNHIGRGYNIYPGRVLRLAPAGGQYMPPSEPIAAAPYAPGPGPVTAPPPVSVAPAAPSAGLSMAPSVAPAGGGPRFEPGRWEWPTRGRVVRGFDPSSGSKGLDIAGDTGQIIVASAGGKVVYSGSALKGYGELVIIKHDEEFLSAYGYNRRRLVQEGEQVVAGQPIAELGLGPEQKPILHFEIRDRGKPVDPQPLLPPR
jgi:lipoprotein NlpD